MPRRISQDTSGFALIEMLCAVILLGILFVLTLKGTVLVDTMRAFMVGYKLEQFQSRILLYSGNHNYLPGDDPSAVRKFGRVPALTIVQGSTVSYTGDERINGKLSDALNPNGEQFMAWRDLRYAGLLEGDPELVGTSAQPENPFGGIYGFDEGNLGHNTNTLCATRIPGRAAELIDQRLDDGVIDQGRVRGTSNYDPANAFNHFESPDSHPYDVDKQYIICLPITP